MKVCHRCTACAVVPLQKRHGTEKKYSFHASHVPSVCVKVSHDHVSKFTVPATTITLLERSLNLHGLEQL